MFLHKKDQAPEETVVFIKSILSELGISVYEKTWYTYSQYCYSVRLEFTDIPDGVNGKGVTRELALASVYGELMERLQNRMLIKEKFGLISQDGPAYPDIQKISFKELKDRIPDILQQLFNFPLKQVIISDETLIDCVPYYDVNNDEVVYLPYEILKRVCASNGMCAGNSFAEAVVQGVSEIYERYVWKIIFTDENLTDLPTIPLTEIADEYSLLLISKLEKDGNKIIVKDCTLGGIYPVVGVVILNSKGRYALRLGSDIDFTIALQRCFTEIFQGVSDTSNFDNLTTVFDLDSDQKITETEYARLMLSARAMPHTNAMFFSQQKPNYRKAFKDISNNQQALAFLLKQISKEGQRLLIRNVSFLGFPSYHVYMPGLSEIQRLSPELLALLMNEAQIQTTLLKLKNSTKQDISKTARFLNNAYKDMLPVTFGGINMPYFSKDADIYKISALEVLLTLLANYLGDYERAYYYLNENYKSYPLEVDRSYILASLLFYKLKAVSMSNDVILSNLGQVFGIKLAKTVISDLDNKEVTFISLKLPNCGDCLLCPANNYCLYEEWKVLSNNIWQKMLVTKISQKKIRTFLLS